MLGTYTKKVDNAIFVIPSKFQQCFINNTGGASATFTGNKRNPDTGAVSEAITIPSQKSFSFPYIGNVYEGITIDATGTVVELIITY